MAKELAFYFRMIRIGFEKYFLERLFIFHFLMILMFFNTSCVQSGAPTVEELLSILSPTINGKSKVYINSPTTSYTIDGECSTDAILTEFSFDNSSWTELACVEGKFTISVNFTNYKEIWVRSKSKFRYTNSAYARIRLLRPPASPSLTLVASSKSENSDDVGIGTQNVMGHSFSGKRSESGSHKLSIYGPGVIYEP